MKKPLRKRCKAKTYNIVLSLYIIVMILANANLVYGISDIHEDRVKEAELFKSHSDFYISLRYRNDGKLFHTYSSDVRIYD